MKTLVIMEKNQPSWNMWAISETPIYLRKFCHQIEGTSLAIFITRILVHSPYRISDKTESLVDIQ